jgi:pimeloyl-ACP methyl ester carboxylesterase
MGSDAKMYGAAHSLGGVMLQDWVKNHSDKVEGIVLMGSVLLRGKHELMSDGATEFPDYHVPTLTIGGTKDGLMRITRVAEAYYHSVDNINAAQQYKFPVLALEGIAHHSFLSGPTYPSHIENNDLLAEVDESEGFA